MWISVRRVVAVVCGLLIAAEAVSGAVGSEGRSESHWVITDLGTLGGAQSWAASINERGQVVGDSVTASGQVRAFLWQKGKMVDLGTLGGPSSNAVAINGDGQVIGVADTKTRAGSDYFKHAFLWQNGRMIDLGTLGGHESRAEAINERGQIVGSSDTSSDPNAISMSSSLGEPEFGMHAFLWHQGKWIDLGALGSRGAEAVDVNDRGAVVGRLTLTGGYSRAFLSVQGKMIRLTQQRESDVSAINDRGQVVGWRADAKRYRRATLWGDGRMTDLGTLGGVESYAHAINGRGEVVGSSRVRVGDPNRYHAFFWRDGKMIDLGTLGGATSSAEAVNDRDQVVGSASTGRSDILGHAFLWQGTKMINLGPPGVYTSEAIAITSSGLVIGNTNTANGSRSRATLWRLR